MQSVPVAEPAGEIHFRTILMWHPQGRGKGDPKHKWCRKKDLLCCLHDADFMLLEHCPLTAEGLDCAGAQALVQANAQALTWGPAVCSKILRKMVKFRDEPGVRDPRGDQQSMISGPKTRNKHLRSFSSFFGENWALRKSSQNHFPMVRVKHFRSFSSFSFEIWALMKSLKTDFSDGQGKQISEVSQFCFFEIWDLLKSF